jgi:hydroxymethylbilane synthase
LSNKFVLGSRGSQLALWQAHWVKQQLEAAGHEVEVRIIKTTGDKLQTASLAASGAKGLFIKEIEEALLDRSIDLAVHSLKDLPTDQPAGLCVAAVPPREDARDVLISRQRVAWEALAPGATIGTSSLRRQSQLRRLRNDLQLLPVRGNLDTRLRKLEQGDWDAIILAAAGVHRLGWKERITAYFQPEELCPAVGQGALAIEIQESAERVRGAVLPLDHAPTHAAILAERAMLRRLGGGCQVPIAAHATQSGRGMHVVGVVASIDGSVVIRAAADGPSDHPEALGTRVAEDLLRQGAEEILENI